MRGSIWSLAVVALFGGLFVRAIDLSKPASPAGSTQAVDSVLSQISPVVGLTLLMIALGATAAISFGRGF
jgi:hypothetical protein